MTLDEIINSTELWQNATYWLMKCQPYTWLFGGFITGFLGYILIFFRKRDHLIISTIVAILGSIPLILLFGLWLEKGNPNQDWIQDYQFYTFFIESVLGMITAAILFRKNSERIGKWYNNLFKKGYESPTDVREIKKHLPNKIGEFNPKDYFKKGSILVGLDEKKKPVYIPYKELINSHMDVVGSTRAGKGVAICVMLYQLIKCYKQTVVVIAPKKDRWAGHVLKRACAETQLPFMYIDLNDSAPQQFNIIQGANRSELIELFSAAFGLGEKGQESDFYRIDDRKLSRTIAKKAETLNNPTLGDLYRFLVSEMPDLHEKVRTFSGSLEEMATLESINSNDGLSIESVIRSGGVLYVDGSMSNPAVLKAQKLLVYRIIQLVRNENKDAQKVKPVALFLDEFKYHISNITLQALGAELGNGLHAILAHQSLDDLGGVSRDLDADMVRGAVIDNTKIKLCYRQENPETAELYARKSGTIQVHSDMHAHHITGLTVIAGSERKTQQVDRHFIDINMLLNLPERCAVMYGIGLSKMLFTSPIKVTPERETMTPKEHGENRVYDGNMVLKSEAESLINVD